MRFELSSLQRYLDRVQKFRLFLFIKLLISSQHDKYNFDCAPFLFNVGSFFGSFFDAYCDKTVRLDYRKASLK